MKNIAAYRRCVGASNTSVGMTGGCRNGCGGSAEGTGLISCLISGTDDDSVELPGDSPGLDTLDRGCGRVSAAVLKEKGTLRRAGGCGAGVSGKDPTLIRGVPGGCAMIVGV
jgi:hypothetical protein